MIKSFRLVYIELSSERNVSRRAEESGVAVENRQVSRVSFNWNFIIDLTKGKLVWSSGREKLSQPCHLPSEKRMSRRATRSHEGTWKQIFLSRTVCFTRKKRCWGDQVRTAQQQGMRKLVFAFFESRLSSEESVKPSKFVYPIEMLSRFGSWLLVETTTRCYKFCSFGQQPINWFHIEEPLQKIAARLERTWVYKSTGVVINRSITFPLMRWYQPLDLGKMNFLSIIRRLK